MCRDDAESTPTGGADLAPALDAVPQHAEMAVERSVASNVQDARAEGHDPEELLMEDGSEAVGYPMFLLLSHSGLPEALRPSHHARSGVCSMPWYCETGHDVAEVGHL